MLPPLCHALLWLRFAAPPLTGQPLLLPLACRVLPSTQHSPTPPPALPHAAWHIGRELTSAAEQCGCESLVMGSRGLGLSKKALMTMLGVGSGELLVQRACPAPASRARVLLAGGFFCSTCGACASQAAAGVCEGATQAARPRWRLQGAATSTSLAPSETCASGQHWPLLTDTVPCRSAGTFPMPLPAVSDYVLNHAPCNVVL